MRVTAMLGGMLVLFTWGLIGVTSGSYTGPGSIFHDEQPSEDWYPQEETMTSTATVNLMVKDMEATLALYRDLLGFEVMMTQPENAPWDWAMVSRGGANLMFQTVQSLKEEDYFIMDNPQTGGTFTIFIVIPDAEALYRTVEGKVTIVKPLAKAFYGFVEFSIRDNNGYLLTFATPVTE